jgi:hypothetical protein
MTTSNQKSSILGMNLFVGKNLIDLEHLDEDEDNFDLDLDVSFLVKQNLIIKLGIVMTNKGTNQKPKPDQIVGQMTGNILFLFV